ncbi:MATE family efflux transporter [Halobellus salinisoli]|uniref:MATE family efflux transporter n=1 Tax=Halobellus salinisoli TaxID=3108500 RepID=UPI0030095C5C
MDSLRNGVRSALAKYPAWLARLGVVDREMGEEIFDLAVPVIVSGGLRTLIRTVDFFMVSLALGSVAVAALQFGFQYSLLTLGIGLALASGTISIVSRFTGARDAERANLALKQSLWLTLVISIPFAVIGWVWAAPLIDVLTDDPEAIALGAIYLKLLMISTPFHFWNIVASRAMAGVGDTRTPMYIRTSSLPTNTVVNAVLIFGLGPFPSLGIAGAAIGTAVANALQAVIFTAAFLSGRFGIELNLSGPHVDLAIVREIVRVSLPLSGTKVAGIAARFPFLFVLGALGTNVVAAYAIGRRIVTLARMPAFGYATASSTLVGQALGNDDEDTAEKYGWQTFRISLATGIILGTLVVIGARQLALLFGADDIGLTVTFIYVFSAAIVGFSISRTFQGALRGAGDTKVPFYATLVGNYVIRLPISVLALSAGVTFTAFGYTVAPGLGIGLTAVFISIWADIYVRAAINWTRYRSNRWKAIGRAGVARARAGAD